MRIKRSVIILYNSFYGKKETINSKLINYKNQRYIEMMKDLVYEYDEIITVDIDEKLSEYNEEEKIIRCIYNSLKNTTNNKVLIISTYIPLVTKDLISYMGKLEFEEDILIPYANNEFQKLCAVYDKSILKSIEYIIEKNRVSFNELFNNSSIRYIFPKDKDMFISVDMLEKYITNYI